MADEIDPAALRIAAPFINQFQILVSGGHVRISFAEGFRGQSSNYRSAVTLSEADARDLAHSILSSIPATKNAFSGLGGVEYPYSTNSILGSLPESPLNSIANALIRPPKKT